MAYRCAECDSKIPVEDINSGVAAILSDNNMYCEECMPAAREVVKREETERKERERAASISVERSKKLRDCSGAMKVISIASSLGIVVGGAMVWATQRPPVTKIGVTIGALAVAAVILGIGLVLSHLACAVATVEETQKSNSKRLDAIRRALEQLA